MIGELVKTPLFTGSMSLITNFGLQYMTHDFQHLAQEIFKYSIARKAVLFALLFAATQSLKLSVIMTVVILSFNRIARKRNKAATQQHKSTQTEVEFAPDPVAPVDSFWSGRWR